MVIKVTKKKKTTFVHPHEEYEHALERVKSAESRIEAVSSLLREMTSECKETKEELSMVVSQKNAIERMLEELEKAKEQAERASRDLQKSVNVLTSELETNKERHVEKVKQWRNEIVSYREKTQENFLAEIVGLVSDMDNDIQIEVVPHSALLPHERAEVHLKEGEREWEHNPRFALEDSARLSVLANCGKSAKDMKQVKAEKILARDSKSRVAGAREESRDADEKSVCENYKQSSDEKHYRKDYHEDDVDETEAATYEEEHVVFFAGCENIQQRVWRDALFRFRKQQRGQQGDRWKVSRCQS